MSLTARRLAGVPRGGLAALKAVRSEMLASCRWKWLRPVRFGSFGSSAKQSASLLVCLRFLFVVGQWTWRPMCLLSSSCHFHTAANRCQSSYRRCRLFRRRRHRFRSVRQSRCRFARFQPRRGRLPRCAPPRSCLLSQSSVRFEPTCHPSLQPNCPIGCKHWILVA